MDDDFLGPPMSCWEAPYVEIKSQGTSDGLVNPLHGNLICSWVSSVKWWFVSKYHQKLKYLGRQSVFRSYSSQLSNGCPSNTWIFHDIPGIATMIICTVNMSENSGWQTACCLILCRRRCHHHTKSSHCRARRKASRLALSSPFPVPAVVSWVVWQYCGQRSVHACSSCYFTRNAVKRSWFPCWNQDVLEEPPRI